MELTVKVLGRRVEADGIASFELAAAGGAALPAVEAGAHIDVHTPAGCVRPYSLCNAPGTGSHYRIAVLREPAGRGGSASMHDQVRVGDELRISAPKNHFALVEDAARVILLAGGIGITPLLAMAERLDALGRDFVLHYSTRSAERTAFAAYLRGSPFADKVFFHHSAGAGRLDIAAALGGPRSDVHVYVCGPKALLDAVRAGAADAGWPDANVHFEYFAGVEAHAPADRPFDVVLRSSGRVIRVEAAQSVTEALQLNGVDVPTSCEQGVCGTCLIRVLEGQVDHRDLYLSPEEQRAQDQFLPCCSRAVSPRLVLDL